LPSLDKISFLSLGKSSFSELNFNEKLTSYFNEKFTNVLCDFPILQINEFLTLDGNIAIGKVLYVN